MYFGYICISCIATRLQLTIDSIPTASSTSSGLYILKPSLIVDLCPAQCPALLPHWNGRGWSTLPLRAVWTAPEGLEHVLALLAGQAVCIGTSLARILQCPNLLNRGLKACTAKEQTTADCRRGKGAKRLAAELPNISQQRTSNVLC